MQLNYLFIEYLNITLMIIFKSEKIVFFGRLDYLSLM
jgi:hypothetical protein